MSTGQESSLSGELAAAQDLVRSAAKWFIGGLGAIGAVLIAGSQLSSVGALRAGSTRLYLAIAGVIVGLLAILWAMWRVVDVLAGKRWTFEELVDEWKATQSPGTGRFRRWRSRTAHPVGWFLRDTPSSLGGFRSPVKIKKVYDESEPEREGLGDLVELMNELLDKASTIYISSRFRTLRRQIAAGVLVGAAAIILFAWAANPATPVQPPPSLRNSDLRNADLRGASLRNADLTGADLTGANLLGADLRGAMTTNAIFSNTTCPDGTNSSASTRPNTSGQLVGGTCDGHLIPAG
jgi:hypothetical protein